MREPLLASGNNKKGHIFVHESYGVGTPPEWPARLEALVRPKVGPMVQLKVHRQIFPAPGNISH